MPARFQSPTSINTYLRCPRKYYLRYIRNLKTKPNIHLLRGKAVHEAIARFSMIINQSENPPPHPLTTLLDLFEEIWHRQLPAMKNLELSETSLDAYRRESRQMLSTWHERQTGQRGRFQNVETKLFSKSHRVMGIIDAVLKQDGKIALVDYKTSASDEITRDIKVQMAVYALLYWANYNELPHHVAIEFLKHGCSKRFRVTPELIDSAARICGRIHHVTRSSNAKDYPCRCGGWCARDFIIKNGKS